MHPTALALKRIAYGDNPRKHFDTRELDELTASVKESGVIQPILVRPTDDGHFCIIAGERRYRAALAAYGEEYEIPVLVKDVDAIEAKALAIIENIQRSDMSPAEEATAAAEYVGLCKGDREEAARVFGWSRTTLDKRLALMNCTAAVLDALTTREILLGHAELFAAFSKADQDKLLPVIVKDKRTVAELKSVLERASCVLSAAIFDKGECAGCPHNSAAQAEMFGESIGTGNCTNRTCYNTKTEAALEATATGLRDEFQTVRIVRAGDNSTRVQLVADGAKGVGVEQEKACHACQHYGAAVSGLPDSLGKVFRGQCFDTVCNMKKVGARINAEKAQANPESSAPTTGKSSGKSAGSQNAATTAKQAAEAVSIAESDKVKAYRVSIWRHALCKDIGRNHTLARQYLTAMVMTGRARNIATDTFRKMFSKMVGVTAPTSEIAEAFQVVQSASEAHQADAFLAMTYAAIEGIEVEVLVELCALHGLDLGKHWKLNKTFLDLLTKSEMKVLVDEIGLRDALGEQYAKTFNKPKPELIDALLAVDGFDYADKVPKVLKF